MFGLKRKVSTLLLILAALLTLGGVLLNNHYKNAANINSPINPSSVNMFEKDVDKAVSEQKVNTAGIVLKNGPLQSFKPAPSFRALSGTKVVLPRGYWDEKGVCHKDGIIRPITKEDTDFVFGDRRVKDNPAYAIVLLLSRVFSINGIDATTPSAIEELYAEDLYYLLTICRKVSSIKDLPIKDMDYTPSESKDSANTELFDFTLPIGYTDANGNIHTKGKMRLATAADEILPLNDPDVKADPSYYEKLLFSRVITQLGDITDINVDMISSLYLDDLAYLQDFYNKINGEGTSMTTVVSPYSEEFGVEPEDSGEQ